ncbi:MAG TPA: hypothetical protein ENI61_00725 [Ignavibacteria bacterium]|nr:hypothetical protein [Ignavibacteria bacterium]
MNKKIMVEKVKIVSHERFWIILFFSILFSLVFYLGSFIILNIFNIHNVVVDNFLFIIYLLLFFMYETYKELAEEKIVKIEKEVNGKNNDIFFNNNFYYVICNWFLKLLPYEKNWIIYIK